ncbi:autotransporter outer membrane beta-barrel domain-containing protein [Myroides sp. LJL110]
MKKTLLFSFLLSCGMMQAQQIGMGIGTHSPDPTAILDIKSTDKGVLFPRVGLKSISDTETISGTKPEGLTVFNTNSTGDLKKGFYYWGKGADGTTDQWNQIVSSADINNYITTLAAYKLETTGAVEGTSGQVVKLIKGDNTAVGSFSESIVELTKDGMPTGTDNDGDIKYTLLNEALSEVEITLTQDVINSFQTIVNDPDVTTILQTFISTSVNAPTITDLGAAGNTDGVQLALEFFDGVAAANNKSILETLTSIGREVGSETNKPKISYSYNDETGAAKENVIVPGQDIIDDSEYIFNSEIIKNKIVSITNVNGSKASLENTPETATGSVKLRLEFNDGAPGSNSVFFPETLTTMIKEVGDGNTTFTKYTYTDEGGIDKEITPSQDFINDVSVILKNETVKEEITNIVVAGSKNPFNKIGTTSTSVTEGDDIYTSGTVVIGGEEVIAISGVTATAKLHVDGNAFIKGAIYSATSVYPDYVFEKYYTGSSDLKEDYEFRDLAYVEAFVKAYNHLPGVTKIADLPMDENGNYVVDFNRLSIEQLEKIEELYLYTIEQQSQIDDLKANLNNMEARLLELERLVLEKK